MLWQQTFSKVMTLEFPAICLEIYLPSLIDLQINILKYTTFIQTLFYSKLKCVMFVDIDRM